MVKQGTLIDATIVEADAKRPPVSEGEISMIDPDAGFTKKNGESYFGYKMHVGVDEGSTLIRQSERLSQATFATRKRRERQALTQVEGTTADINDCLVFKGLVSGDETFVCADKAYGSQDHRTWLLEHGIADRLMHKAQKNKPLVNWQVWFNKSVAIIRSGVERIFGVGKRSYGLGRARYRGIERVRGHFFMIAMAYNLRRAVTIVVLRDGLAA